MSIVDIELSEDVLAMSVDSMKAGETFFGYFLGRHTESDVYQNLSLCLGEFHFFLSLGRWRCKKHLRHVLTDKAIALHTIQNGSLDFRQLTIFGQDTELRTACYEHTYKVHTQVFAEEQPSGVGESLVQDEQLDRKSVV